VISLETARTMMQLLQAVVRQGTGVAASQMKHPFGGKTGTTNDFTDAWFIGFSPSVTCGTWIGFDDRQSLGKKETGARAALPMWMDFMRAAIANKPNETFATGGAPKKTLDVPLSKPTDADRAKRFAPKPSEDVDPDAPAGDGGPAKSAAPVASPSAAPSMPEAAPGSAPSDKTAPPPVDKPKAPEGTHSTGQAKAAPVNPAKTATASAKAAEDQQGVSNPPPDTN
jgi:penicillin-binding protein 1A